MKQWILLPLSLTALLFVGCATPTKSSKLNYLTGDGDTHSTAKVILADISRTYNLKAKRPWTEKEKKQMADTKEYAVATTSTWVKIYPYTKPLVNARITEAVNEKAYGEKWAPEKIQPEISRQIAAESKRVLDGKQCFAMEMTVDDAEAMKLEYWHGDITQNGQTMKLSFTKGAGLVKTISNLNAIGGHVTNESYNFADACVVGKIDFAREFKLEIEPRFKREILPFSLTWLAPSYAPATASAASVPAPAPAPAPTTVR